MERGVQPEDFNSYGSRRGNDEVMARGTFANIRLNNKLVGKTGPQTVHAFFVFSQRSATNSVRAFVFSFVFSLCGTRQEVHIPSGETMDIYDAANKYAGEQQMTIILGGKESTRSKGN